MHSEPSQTSITELFPYLFSQKKSILDFWLDSEYAGKYFFKVNHENIM